MILDKVIRSAEKDNWFQTTLYTLLPTGETVRDQGEMYKAVDQSVLLYGSKIWVVTGEMLKALMEFHHKAAQQITVMTAKRRAGGGWEYRIHPKGLYIKRQQTTIVERVACRPLCVLFTES